MLNTYEIATIDGDGIAVKETGTDEISKVIAHIRKGVVNDRYASNASVREDGRLMTDLKLVQVKTPEESKYPWDYYKIVRSIPAAEAFMTKAESKCALWK